VTPSELFGSWLAWNARDVLDQAARRAEAAGDTDRAATLRRSLAEDPAPTRAIDALAAQHQLAAQLSQWRWHAVTSAREQGASWADIAAATDTDPASAREVYREQVERAQRTADAIDIPLLDADRYRAAARDDDHQAGQGEHRRDRDGQGLDGARTDGARTAAADLADDHQRDDAMRFPDTFGGSPDQRTAQDRSDQAHSDQARAAGPTDGDHVASAEQPGDDPWRVGSTEGWSPPERDNLILEYWADEAERAGQHEQAARHRRAADQLFVEHDQWAADNPELADELRQAGINTRGWTHNQRDGLLAARADPDGGYWQAAAEDRADRLAAADHRDAAEHDSPPSALEDTGTAADGGSGWERGPDAAHWSAEVDAAAQLDDVVTHIRGPRVDADGFLVGEIELPGGLPPEDDEDDVQVEDVPRWDEALAVADRDGFVLFDPEAPGGFRALTSVEHRELIDAVRAGTPAGITTTGADDDAPEEKRAESAEQDRDGYRWGDMPAGTGAFRGESESESDSESGPTGESAALVEGEPWFETEEAVAARERWAIENADPAKALDDSHPDDPEVLRRRIDDIRTRLTGYTWRDGVDRDEALADRREQLARWYADDTDQTDIHGDAAGEDAAGEAAGSDMSSGTGPVPDPRWYS
jgi:hypothetical protein